MKHSPKPISAKISELIPYASNPKEHTDQQISRLKHGINSFGMIQPILVDENRTIIIGHGRVQALQALGIESLEGLQVFQVDTYSEDEKRALRIFDNSINAETGFVSELLTSELEALSISNFDLESLGMHELIEPARAHQVLEEKVIEAPPVNPITKPGDLWTFGSHRLLCGDSTNSDHVAHLLAGETPFIMVTDPPYGVKYDPNWRDGVEVRFGKTESTGKVKNDDLANWTNSYKLFSGAVVYVWHGGRVSAEVAQNISDAEFEIRAQIIWRKQHFAISRGHYHWQHEPCWYAVRKGISSRWCGDRKQSTVWDIQNNNSFGGAGEEKLGHGTQKPVECMARPIRNHGAEGDLVYDPFVGSGTTIIAAETTKRRCVALEIDPGYCDLVLRRFFNLTGIIPVNQRGEAFILTAEAKQ